jgi:non-canonical poly(A) RNA polymerase PAPD5/7
LRRLGVEIERFYAYSKPDYSEAFARRHVIEQVRNHVRTTHPDHVLEVFGSERTGLALATSDIDLRLFTRKQLENPGQAKLPPTPEERAEGMRSLHELLSGNLSKHKAYLLARLRYARYPLISLQDRQSGLDIQIVLANDTSLSREIMKGYMEDYPYLRQLYFVVKTMFDVRGLNDVFRGGFGSYSIFMMLVASIKHMPHRRNDAAGALINFLKFYRNFNTQKQGISIEPPFLFDKTKEAVMSNKIKAKLEVHAASICVDSY